MTVVVEAGERTMCVPRTPVEHYPAVGLWTKREDLCCPGGPNFSKTRGVWVHVHARSERVIGVLDTSHSQGGWAVARACSLLGRECHLFYPVRKGSDPWLAPQQLAAQDLGARLTALPAGRSAVLYHRARAAVEAAGGYMMPNALKLPESVEETAREARETCWDLPATLDTVLVSASSGTLAAGVVRGFQGHPSVFRVVVHLGYSRPEHRVRTYMKEMSGGFGNLEVEVVDEGYAYADVARPGPTPPFPCNQYYDLKSFRYWMGSGRGEALMWNIG